ncbi:MAG: Hsp20/alpha crystallin family protein [Bacteroidota bacterium]|nr:Hsp20/alpha crystallin family protein [Bacteroidota bacterium]MDP4232730.1 Hsp20/alpha crystallin family protein [Bacteroidota bacterium]MDP4243137.1 Hsp20/alpha crystallin family protein [Bacteroidota bacterium]MDP4287594.1 Hsp20/alpha crystallin family protein [Bacteroidota bacterium]
MAITKWEPRGDFDLMTRGMRRLFEDFDHNFFNFPTLTAKQGGYMPSVDINEDKDNLYFIAELPGLASEDVKITISEGVLTIRGEKKREEEHHDRNFYRMERSYGEFVRQFTLPEDVKEEDIQANFKDGVLEILVPKTVPSTPKEREVKIASNGASRKAEISQGNGRAKAS